MSLWLELTPHRGQVDARPLRDLHQGGGPNTVFDHLSPSCGEDPSPVAHLRSPEPTYERLPQITTTHHQT